MYVACLPVWMGGWARLSGVGTLPHGASDGAGCGCCLVCGLWLRLIV